MSSLTFNAKAANIFWHERLGRFLGGQDALTSLGATYPVQTKSGAIKPMRIGAGSTSAILIDGKNAIAVEALATERIKGLNGSGVVVKKVEAEFSLTRGIMNWVLDPSREYPMLVLMPGKASSRATLRLSHLPTEIAICSPGAPLVFDGVRVRTARDIISAMGSNGRKWKLASSARARVSSGDYLRDDSHSANEALEVLVTMNETFPTDIWLPTEGDPEFEALGMALIESKPGLPL